MRRWLDRSSSRDDCPAGNREVLDRSLVRGTRLIAVALAVIQACPVANAEPAARLSTAPARIVVTYQPDVPDQRTVTAALEAHLSDLPVEVLAEPVSGAASLGKQLGTAGALATARGALGTFSVEITEDRALLIFFTEPDGQATRIRRLDPDPQGLRVATEQAAIVVRSLVEALLEGARIGLETRTEQSAPSRSEQPGANQEPGPGEEPATQATPSGATGSSPGVASRSDPAETFTSRLAVSGGYLGTDWGPDFAWQSGASLGASWLMASGFYLGARFTWSGPMEARTRLAGVSIQRRPLEWVVGYAPTGPIAPVIELGVLGDWTTRNTSATDPGLKATPSEDRWLLSLGARAGVAAWMSSSVRVTARCGADWLLTRYSYVVAVGEALSPAAFRPRVEAELAAVVW